MNEETILQGPPLTVGLLLGGAKASRLWEDAVKKLMRRIKSTGTALNSSCRVQAVFDVPGEVTSPKSIGIIFPRQAYKPAERRIYVGIGLPPEPRSDAYEEAVQFLRQALEEAESYLTRKQIPGDLDAAIEIVRDLASR